MQLNTRLTIRSAYPYLLSGTWLAAPTTHFVSFARAILSRGADFGIICPQFLALIAVGCMFFVQALIRFRKTVGSTI